MTPRARLRPDEMDSPSGGRRRVPALRREDAAQLAKASTKYYTKTKRGNVAGVSDDVLRAIANALLFSNDETTHFFDL